jgi:hypothetical protein
MVARCELEFVGGLDSDLHSAERNPLIGHPVVARWARSERTSSGIPAGYFDFRSGTVIRPEAISAVTDS